MGNSQLKYIIRFVILVVLQVLFFSNLPVFKYAHGFIYVFFLLFLPLHWPKYIQLLVGFFCGLVIDILTGTYGLHAIAATCIIAFREPILKIILPRYNEEEWQALSLFDRNLFEFSTYALAMSFLYCLIFFSLNFFSSKMLFELLLHVFASTIFTFILLFLYRYIFAVNQHEND